MHIVDDRYLLELGSGSLAIPEIKLANEDDLYNILLLSDIHLPAPEFVEDERRRKSQFADYINTDFSQRCESLIGSLGQSRHWNLIINCGDIISGSDVGKYLGGFKDDPGAYKTYNELYGDFAKSALEHLKKTTNASDILTIPGNHDVYRLGTLVSAAEGEGPRRYQPYYDYFASKLSDEESSSRNIHEQPCMFLAKITGPNAGEVPLAYVAVVGFDSNQAEYEFSFVTDFGKVSNRQIEIVRDKLLPAVKKKTRDAPLYLIGIMHHHLLPIENFEIRGDVEHGRKELHRRHGSLTCLKHRKEIGPEMVPDLCATNQMKAFNTAGVTTNAPDLIKFFQEERFSLIVHGHMHSKKLRALSELSFSHAATEQQITILSCPSFNRGTDYKGLKGIIGLRMDLSAGETHLICTAETNDPADTPKLEEKTVQITRPLTSVSRVSSSEMRLFRKVVSYLQECPERKNPTCKDKVESFEQYVRKTFQNHGYVPVCNEAGKDLSFLRPVQRRRYFLLSLLKREQGRFSMLLNRHTPIRLSSLADWDTLLVPAFSSVRDLLSRFLNDILKQHMEVAERAKDAEVIRAHIERLTKLLEDENFKPDNWEKMLRMVSARKPFIKFSPTDGFPIEYEYTLVTLDSLVSPAAWKQYNDFRDFIGDLPAIVHPEIDKPQTDRHRFSIDALHEYGTGLRINPDSEDPEKGNKKENYTRSLPHGAIWFPIRPPGETNDNPYWLGCPSIVARNADVMGWIDAELQRMGAAGSYPTEVLLGEHEAASRTVRIEESFPFRIDAPEGAAGLGSASESTTTALKAVCYDQSYDLKGEKAYSGLDMARVVLKKSIASEDAYGRQTVDVFKYEGSDTKPNLDELTDCIKVGVLRPVQRYVLSAGIERAHRINGEVLDQLEDRWGYAKIRSEGGGTISVTPPIIEQIDGYDCEGDGTSLEFIVCDGNHRIVERVWKEGKAMAAVAILGAPREPFYAHPFSKYEWRITAENELRFTPDTASKYTARRFDQSQLATATEGARQAMESIPQSEFYRRYFRDLTTGFGYTGGQGGRPA